MGVGDYSYIKIGIKLEGTAAPQQHLQKVRIIMMHVRVMKMPSMGIFLLIEADMKVLKKVNS
jgi:hypothetical protein